MLPIVNGRADVNILVPDKTKLTLPVLLEKHPANLNISKTVYGAFFKRREFHLGWDVEGYFEPGVTQLAI